MTCLWEVLKDPVLQSPITEKIDRASYKSYTWRKYKRHQNHRKTGGLSCLRHFLKSWVLTSLTTENTCLASYETQTSRNFQKEGRYLVFSGILLGVKFSRHFRWRQLVLCRTGRKPAECPADIEILIKRAISAVPKTFEKSSYWPIIKKLCSATYQAETCRMYQGHENYRKLLSAMLSSHVTRNREKLSCVVHGWNFQNVLRTLNLSRNGRYDFFGTFWKIEFSSHSKRRNLVVRPARVTLGRK